MELISQRRIQESTCFRIINEYVGTHTVVQPVPPGRGGGDLHPGGPCVRQHCIRDAPRGPGKPAGYVLSRTISRSWNNQWQQLCWARTRIAKFRISDAFRSIIVRQHHPELSGADGAPDPTPPAIGEGDVRGPRGSCQCQPD